MTHRQEIINWLVYWQMGSCGRNCREKVQWERVPNRNSGPIGRRGTGVFFSPFQHTKIPQQAAGTAGYVQILMRVGSKCRLAAVCIRAEVRAEGGGHSTEIMYLHTRLQACCKDMALLKLVCEPGDRMSVLSVTHIYYSCLNCNDIFLFYLLLRALCTVHVSRQMVPACSRWSRADKWEA